MIAVARPKLTSVPNVVGMTVDNAKAALTTASLVLDVTGQRPVPGTPAGIVLDQNPQAGPSIVVGSPVHVNVSAVDPTVEVPDIRQQTVANAQALLAQVNLRLSQRGTQASVQPAGIVLSQDPLPGSRAPTGSVISVVVSAGGLVVVPGLIGRTAVRGRGAAATPRAHFSSDVVVNLSRPPGTVFSPGPGRGRPGADRHDRGHARRHPPDRRSGRRRTDHPNAAASRRSCRHDDTDD